MTELRHTPASPSLLRKAGGQGHVNTTNVMQHSTILQTACTSVERSSATTRSTSKERGTHFAQAQISSTAAVSNQGQGPGGVGQSFMAALNAKLINSTSGNSTGSGSPKPTRKHSTDQQLTKNTKTSSGFLETLNAKLAQQQQTLQGNNVVTSRSASVRRIMGNRVPIMDPAQVRDSLMDQIRRGTSLRKTSGPINDRSAPKIC